MYILPILPLLDTWVHAFNANNSILTTFSVTDYQWVWSIKTSLLYTCNSIRQTSILLEQLVEMLTSRLGVSCKTFAVPHTHWDYQCIRMHTAYSMLPVIYHSSSFSPCPPPPSQNLSLPPLSSFQVKSRLRVQKH